MAVTYTDKLHLGMQLDKTDYVDWDAITQNWQKIDAASNGGVSVSSVPMVANGIPIDNVPEIIEEDG